jgi:pimeloyl-ACP methyl ester carboxylesterase
VGYSQAEHHAARGLVLVAMDHLGVGDSSTDANETILIEDIAAANDAAVREVLRRLREGSLDSTLPALQPGFVVGTGQSMGGGVTIIMQGRHRTYEAIAPLGYSAVQAVLPLRDPEARQGIKAMFSHFRRNKPPAQLSVPHTSERIGDFLHPFHWEDVPRDIVEADLAGGYPLRQDPPPWGSRTVPRCVVGMMARDYVIEEAAAVDVPVFFGEGERDVSENPWEESARFPRVRDFTLFVCPQMAHMHNFASTRRLLWERSVEWIESVRRLAARVEEAT